MAAADLIAILQQTGGISAIASQLGIPPAMAEAGASALLPAIVGGFSKQTEAPSGADAGGGLGSLIGMLGGLGGAGLAANVLGPETTNVDKGNDVLGQIFGSKDVSRTVATHASNQTGIDPALLKKMLPILAMLVAGYMAHAGGAQQGDQPSNGGGMGGMLTSVLGSVLGGGAAAAPVGGGQVGGGMGGMLGSLLGMATGASGGSGNALDEIIGMAGKLTR